VYFACERHVKCGKKGKLWQQYCPEMAKTVSPIPHVFFHMWPVNRWSPIPTSPIFTEHLLLKPHSPRKKAKYNEAPMLNRSPGPKYAPANSPAEISVNSLQQLPNMEVKTLPDDSSPPPSSYSQPTCLPNWGSRLCGIKTKHSWCTLSELLTHNICEPNKIVVLYH